jgi:hypothetical protein
MFEPFSFELMDFDEVFKTSRAALKLRALFQRLAETI